MSPRDELRARIADIAGPHTADQIMALFAQVIESTDDIDVTGFNKAGQELHRTRWITARWPVESMIVQVPPPEHGIPPETVREAVTRYFADHPETSVRDAVGKTVFGMPIRVVDGLPDNRLRLSTTVDRELLEDQGQALNDVVQQYIRDLLRTDRILAEQAAKWHSGIEAEH